MEEKDAISLLPEQGNLDSASIDILDKDNEVAKAGYVTASHDASFHQAEILGHTLDISNEGPEKEFWPHRLVSRQARWRRAVYEQRKVLMLAIAIVILLVLGLGIVLELTTGKHAVKHKPSLAASYRSAFHFQPPDGHWMNDPNGPVFYKGYYHLFFQYNGLAAVWGNITWGHAVSSDLIHWNTGPIALAPDEWYDRQGVWSGSATVLQDGSVVLVYTGLTNQSVQVQNLATPVDAADPLLRQWKKSPQNPVISPPPGVNNLDFRDPTTAWLAGDGRWRMLVGARLAGSGAALMYSSPDFRTWTPTSAPLHAVPGSPMWECPDLFPVAHNAGLPLGVHPAGTPYVLKASIDHTLTDSYALGSYDAATDTWAPRGPDDVSQGRLLDYGKYYASKSFYDPVKGRRVLFGWIYETDSQQSNIRRGWASVQALPRAVELAADGADIVQWPVAEVDALRKHAATLRNVTLPPGARLELPGVAGCQLDLELAFTLPPQDEAAAPPPASAASEPSRCSPEGSAGGGALAVGPFGVAVLAAGAERTAAYFELARNGTAAVARVCTDLRAASLAPDTDRGVYGSAVRREGDGATLSMRVIVDHSVVEVFAEKGHTVVTTRSYPLGAMDQEARVFLFNNGSNSVVLQQATAWSMNSISISSI
ncbi:beta-fructofuranosidase (invertase) [Klebsormidium nitens]|uniref:Beta-fructofuranosidase (Invertase) n=1 Tax=Klebsormidium nitens TaxID=105231 RepID=A0A1Y1ID88_KLENI|nr:beta-fructofuranosidase (invertase) [Klebsormidium nitens]|eukprot:GAQ88880.1 beta-fructofuranosidase (invertase) [Klebsormidium nitens]